MTSPDTRPESLAPTPAEAAEIVSKIGEVILEAVTTADYSPGSHDTPETAPLELPAVGDTSTPARPPESLDPGEWLTITDAASAYGVSVSTLHRRRKAGEIVGAVKVPGPKGEEWRIPPESLEALGYKPKETRAAEAVKAARAGLEAESLEARVRELEASLELERVRREAAETEAEALRGNLDDLRTALAKLPAALPPATPRRRWWRKGEK